MEPRKPDTPAWPLTPMQQAMLFRSLAMPEAGYYVQQMVCTLDERLDVDRFRQAWELVASRHDTLRTCVQWRQDVPPQQLVQPHTCIPLEHVDATGLRPDQRAQRLEEFLAADRQRGMALDQPPLWRLTLLRWSAEAWTCIWTFHHLLLDGRSHCRVLEEVFAAYAAPDAAPPPPSRPFQNYVGWLSQQNHTSAAAFWKQQLEHFPGAWGLPTLWAGPEISSGPDTHGLQQLELDVETTQRLRSLAKSHGVTLNNLVQGAWALALGRYNGTDEVVFGATRACRHWGDQSADDSVGLLINTVPFRVRIAPDLPLARWLRGLREQQVALRPHEHSALSQIRQWAGLPGDAPLFRTLLVFENFRPEERLARLGAGRRFVLREKTDVLTLAAYAGQTLVLAAEYERIQYSDIGIRMALAHLRQLLMAMLAAPADSRLGDLAMITPEELELMRGPWQGPCIPYPDNTGVHRLVEEQVEHAPDGIAIECGAERITFAALNRRANQLARRLLQLGQQQDRVGVCLERSPDIIVAFLAIVKAGMVYVPLDPVNPRERLTFYLNDSGATILLTQRILVPNIPPGRVLPLCLDDEHERAELATLDSGNLDVAIGPEDEIYILFTSGSTGQPKGVIGTHRCVCNMAMTQRQAFDVSPGDRVLQLSSPNFDASVFEIILALQTGATLVVTPLEQMQAGPTLAACLKEQRISFILGTPSGWKTMAPIPLPDVRLLTLGGEVITADLVARWTALGRRFINIYGPTECTVWSSYEDCLHDGNHPSIGRPLPNFKYYVLNEKLRPVPVGVPGELFIGGPGVARGYLNRPELTAERFLVDPFSPDTGARMYRTGDLVRWLPDGRVGYLRRMDFQVKFRGMRIELGEIEAILCQHPHIREAVVLLQDDQLLACLVADPPTPTPQELRRFLEMKLQRFMIPERFAFLAELPRTISGKVDRKALLAQSTQPQAVTTPSTPATVRSVTAAERQQLLVEWNQTALAVPCESSIVELVEAQVRQRPDHPALQQDGEVFTYAALNRRANHIADQLRQAGLRTEEPVVILMECSFEFVCAMFGVLKAGGAYVPLDAAIPTSRAEFIVRDCGARFALVQSDLKEKLRTTGLALLDGTESKPVDTVSPPGSHPPATPHQRAYIIYTSGSTGRPKGVEIEHHSLLNLVTFYRQRCDLTPNDRATMLANVSFDASVADLWPYLAVGACVHIPPPPLVADPERLVAWLTQQRITISFLPTVIAELALACTWPEHTALRLMLTGGDTLRVRPRPNLPFQLLNTYGPTENTVDSIWSVVAPGEHAERPPIGRPIGNVQAYVLDEQQQPVPVGVPGELYLGGAQVGRGYLNQPGLTRIKFIPDPFSNNASSRLYRTGDWVRWRADGELDFIGRMDDQIQIRGSRVELGEIEEVLRQHPAVREACVRPLLENNTVQGVVAYVVAEGEPMELRLHLRAFLGKNLPCPMLPQNFTFLPALPRNTSGKVDRQALPPPDPQGTLVLTTSTPPRNEIERQLLGLFEDVLKVQGVGIEDNFFELGGHSLLSLRLLNRIEQHFGLKIPIAALFQTPTVAQLAPRLSADAAQVPVHKLPACVVLLRAGPVNPPLFLVTGAGGGAHWFQGIARHMADRRAVYALEMLALSDHGRYGSIQEIAAEFLVALRQVQPRGPYLLGGFSVGGHVAFEMAQRLHDAGEKIDLLALIDCYGPDLDARLSRQIWVYLCNFLQRNQQEKIQFFHEKVAWLRFLWRIRSSNRDTREKQNEIDRAMAAQVAAAERYAAQPWRGDIVLMRSSIQPNRLSADEYCGWRSHIAGAIAIHVIPGNHFALFQPPQDQLIARLLGNYISKTGAPEPSLQNETP